MNGPGFVVTGGAGFVGANLVAALLAREPDAQITVVDSFRSGSFANIVEACARVGRIFTGRVEPRSHGQVSWRAICSHYPAAIFHLGAITDTTVLDEHLMLEENVGDLSEMFREAAMKQIPLVYASSAATYGTPAQTRERAPFPLEAAGKPNNVYGFSKWMMECEHRRFAAEWREAAGNEPWVVGLRYFNVFGPGESRKGKMASMVYQLAQQVIAGERPRIFEDGSQARDQVYVDDVVECTLAAAGIGNSTSRIAISKSGEGGVRPGVYNLGSGVATSFSDIVDAVRGGLGVSAQERPTDYFPMPAEIRAFYQDYTCADMSGTERGLRWRPRHEPRAAMREYARWLAGESSGGRGVT